MFSREVHVVRGVLPFGSTDGLVAARQIIGKSVFDIKCLSTGGQVDGVRAPDRLMNRFSGVDVPQAVALLVLKPGRRGVADVFGAAVRRFRWIQ